MKNSDLLLICSDSIYISYFAQFAEEFDWSSEIRTFNEIQKSFYTDQQWQLVIIDIKDGQPQKELNIVRTFKQLPSPLLVLTDRTDSDFYRFAQRLDPGGLLIKPFHQFSLWSAIDRLLKVNSVVDLSQPKLPPTKNSSLVDNYIFIKNSKNIFKNIYIPNIHTIEAQGNYCFIHTQSSKYAVKISLRKIQQQLQTNTFIQIHRNYLVQIMHIESIDLTLNQLVINHQSLPLGATYKQRLTDRLKFLK